MEARAQAGCVSGSREGLQGVEEGSLSKYARTLIACKARRLVGRAGFTRSDVEDIQSELTLHLLERLPRFNPKKSRLNTFITRVVEDMAEKLVRHRTMEKRDFQREACSLNEDIKNGEGVLTERAETLSREEHDVRLRGRAPQNASDMALDVERVMSRLPKELRELCELLQTMSVTDAARKLGIPRSTVRGRVRKLREVFHKAGVQDYL